MINIKLRKNKEKNICIKKKKSIIQLLKSFFTLNIL